MMADNKRVVDISSMMSAFHPSFHELVEFIHIYVAEKLGGEISYRQASTLRLHGRGEYVRDKSSSLSETSSSLRFLSNLRT